MGKRRFKFHTEHKVEKYRTRITVGGNNISFPYSVYTPTADITLIKVLLNSVVSIEGAKFAVMDIADFYLNTTMERSEYIVMNVELIPEDFRTKNKLNGYVQKGKIYW